MKHETSRDIYAYWNRLRGGRPAPERTEVAPAGLRGILGDVFILEATRAGHAFRLAGTRLCIAYGGELKGRALASFWTPQDREAIDALLATVTEDGAGAVVGYRAHNAHGQSVPFELLLLPLRHRERPDSRVLGSAAPFETPYWLGSIPLVAHEIASLRILWPDEQPHFLRAPPSPSTFAGAPPHRRVGHLTLYDGGRG